MSEPQTTLEEVAEAIWRAYDAHFGGQIEAVDCKILAQAALSAMSSSSRDPGSTTQVSSDGWSLSEDQYDGIRDMIVKAYEAGAMAVHENHDPTDRDPDFTEAAYDYTTSVTDEFLKLFPSVPSVSDGWRTIDSAPKDGTHFIGFKSGIVARETFWDFYQEGSISYNLYKEGKGPSGSWSDYTREGWCLPFHPTHWMPLPAAPVLGDGE